MFVSSATGEIFLCEAFVISSNASVWDDSTSSVRYSAAAAVAAADDKDDDESSWFAGYK